jgi:hypothetical protein
MAGFIPAIHVVQPRDGDAKPRASRTAGMAGHRAEERPSFDGLWPAMTENDVCFERRRLMLNLTEG